MILIVDKHSVSFPSLKNKKVNKNNNDDTPKTKKHLNWRHIRKVLKWITIPILTIGISAFAFGAFFFFSYISKSPELELGKLQSQPNTTIMDNKGKVIAQLGTEQRVLVTTDQIPMLLVDAITSIEDRRFFNHKGVDPIRIVGSALNILKGGNLQGGSTLTQELIKLSFFSTGVEDQNLERKAQEAWMAIELEKTLSKEEILTLYINKVYMANGYYGMQTAAENYYQKSLKDLSLPQIALLAGMPQAPSSYDPYIYPENAKVRRDMVLQQMYKYEKISKSELDAALETPIDDGLKALPTSSTIPHYLNNYLTQVLLQVTKETGKDPNTTSMQIYTTLDNDAQKHLFEVVNGEDYINYIDKEQQVATTIIDVKTGAVIAQLGGRNQPTDSVLGTNPAVNTDRDWGSTMKPITDYAPGLDNGTFKSTAHRFEDTPYNFPGTSDPVYNWDLNYMGTITMRTALWQSRNITATKALASVGLDESSAFLKKLGIEYPSIVYSNAFSSNTSELGNQWGVSSEKMAAAFAAFANGGKYYSPYYVTKIVYSDNTTVETNSKAVQAMKESTAYMMTDMLKGVITSGTNGSSFPPNQLGPSVFQAGKTGTSNYTDEEMQKVMDSVGYYQRTTIAPDSTFVGYTSDYAMATWTGYTNRMTPVYADGLLVPANVYTEMMKYLYPDYTSSDWKMPTGIFRAGQELYVNGENPNSYIISSSKSSNSKSSSSSSSSKSSSEASSSSSSVEPPASSSDVTTDPSIPESSSEPVTGN
ncbi:MAG: transglycosylase domain-containing protein [Lactovum sp.]